MPPREEPPSPDPPHEIHSEWAIAGAPESDNRRAMTVSAQGVEPGVSSATRRWLVAILLALFTLQVIFTSRQMSPAFDEVALLPVGYVFLMTGQWELVREHPPLIFALSALPLLALKPRLDRTDPTWVRYGMNIWRAGSGFLMANDMDRLLLWARLPTLLLSILLGYFVYRWAAELYGGNAGVMALALYAFSPITITNSGFASYDLGLSCFFTLSLYWLWRFVTVGTWHNLLWTGLFLGCALASKTPAVVLPPIFVVLMLLAVWHAAAIWGCGKTPRGRATRASGHGGGAPGDIWGVRG